MPNRLYRCLITIYGGGVIVTSPAMTSCHWLLVVYSYGVIFYHYSTNHMLVAITTASIYILVWALCQGLDQVTLENCVLYSCRQRGARMHLGVSISVHHEIITL